MSVCNSSLQERRVAGVHFLVEKIERNLVQRTEALYFALVDCLGNACRLLIYPAFLNFGSNNKFYPFLHATD
jgi:hypothetical protein